MKTKTSIEGFLNMAVHDIKDQLPKIHQLEQIEIVARHILKTWENGCSFADLEPLIVNLAIAMGDEK